LIQARLWERLGVPRGENPKEKVKIFSLVVKARPCGLWYGPSREFESQMKHFLYMMIACRYHLIVDM